MAVERWWKVAGAVLCGAALVAGSARAQGSIDSPVGRWRTFDDRTKQPRGIVRIYEDGGKLFGKVERSVDAAEEGAVCVACTDERKGQPIAGLVIIRGMTRTAADPRVWDGGDVLDPDDGKVYRFRMKLEDGGARLVVRGFIGVSLIGRSQTWQRLP